MSGHGFTLLGNRTGGTGRNMEPLALVTQLRIQGGIWSLCLFSPLQSVRPVAHEFLPGISGFSST